MAELAVRVCVLGDTAVDHGAVYGGRSGESEAIAHRAAVFWRQIRERRGDDLRRVLRRDELPGPRARQLFPEGNCSAGLRVRGGWRISVFGLAGIPGEKEVPIQFQDLEMKAERGRVMAATWLADRINACNLSIDIICVFV